MSRDAIRLDRGNHPDPDAGCCLMEYVSVLDGGRFGPLPRCTHPALAALVMQVNDRTSDAGRAALVSRAERLRRADSDDPGLGWRLVEVCATAVLARSPGDAAARRRLARSGRARGRMAWVLPGGLRTRLPRAALVAVGLGALDELVGAFHAVLAVAGPAGSPERDGVLSALLDDALDVVTGTDGAPDTHHHPREEALTA
ncbi:hypothetical protein LQ327_05255 [Actinomycetospora endophytica]|uniref:Golgi phosphoprotein 3 GPP34 n=1 Tax=Actinomycetospora endophytica TaxID=2291215 RepID=A0ABS8P3G1_9PSEU|nr:hypothetical protein [Actinomycetospora endophytica]MCD2192794.1 hypothetical protein [Actinomycetospora endophytica]